MKKTSLLSYFLFPIFYFALVGCASSPPKRQAVPITDPSKLLKGLHLVVTSTVSSDTIEWGKAYEIPLEVLWASGRRMPVQLAAAQGTPGWLKVDIQPETIDTTSQVTVRITPLPGRAPISKLAFAVEVQSDSLAAPVRRDFSFFVRRQTGHFTRLQFGIEPAACDSFCARVLPSGELAFYDLRSTGASCTDQIAIPESKRLGPGLPLSQRGYAWGSGCRVAAYYSLAGELTFVNLGISPRLPIGAALLSLRGASACWLSPDNTLALIALPGAAMAYEVATGRMVGGPCQLSSDTVKVRVYNNVLRAGLCKWELP